MSTLDSKGFVCEYKKRSAWFGSFEIRYIVIEEERIKVFKNEKDYVSCKKRHSKPSITIVLRNARLKVTSEQRHPHILSIQVSGTYYYLSFVNKEQLLDCQNTMTKVIQSANLIFPTIDQQHIQNTQSNIDQKDLNTKYRAVLTHLGLPKNKIEELIKTQSFVSKMEIVTQNQSQLNINDEKKTNHHDHNHHNNNNNQNRNKEIMHWIKLLRRTQHVTLANITDIAHLLYEQSNEWMINFINEQGLTLLVSIIPYQINNAKYQIELLQCFKAICDKTYENDKIGLKYIVNDSTAIQGIIDLFDSQDAQVSMLIIKLLSVICWHSPEGFEKVIDGLENYCDVTSSQSMWIPIVTELKPMIAEISNNDMINAPRDQFAFEYVLFSMGLINAILNSFTDLEDRVSYRKDLEQLGFDKIVSYLSDLIISMEEALYDDENSNDSQSQSFIDDPWIDKMDEHLDLYQAVKLKDMRDSSLHGIDVSNPNDLFQFLQQHSVEDGFLNEFTHILQCLTTIPKHAPYLWSTIEKIVSYSTAPIRKQQLTDIIRDNDNDRLQSDLSMLEREPEEAFPSFVQLKVMLSRYDQDLAYMETESTHYKEQIGLLNEQITNLKYHLSSQQIKFSQLKEEFKKLRYKQRDSKNIRVPKDDFHRVLNESLRKKKEKKKHKHKRKTSLLDKMRSGIFSSKPTLTLAAAMDGDTDSDEEDNNNHLIDMHNPWQNMNGHKSPHSLNTSTTEHTPPPSIKTHTPTSSFTSHKQPRGYSLRSPTNTMSKTASDNSIISNISNLSNQNLAPITPHETQTQTQTQIPEQSGVASIGLPPPPPTSEPNSPRNHATVTVNTVAVEDNKDNSTIQVEHVDTDTDTDTDTVTQTAVSSGPPPQLLKYLKMLKMGLPQVAVEHKMRKDKVDVDILTEYLDNGGSIDVNANTNTTEQKTELSPQKKSDTVKEVKTDMNKKSVEQKNNSTAEKKPPEKLKKYLKMHKLNIPMKVIENKMKQNGDNIQELHDWLNPPKKPDNKPKEPPPELSKYLRMLKMKIPLPVVKNKMKQNGDKNKIQLLLDWLNPPTQTQTDNKPKEPPPEISKYLRMIKMKIPLPVVKNKMKQNGDKNKIQLLLDWLNPPTQTQTDNKPKEPPPEISKYLRMIKMKIPLHVVKNKMKQNGDSDKISILENFVNGTNTNTAKKIVKKKKKKEDPNALPSGMKAKPKIKPKQKMRALHWSTVRPKEIKNTIWDGLDESKIQIDVLSFEKMFQRKVIEQKTNQKNNDKKVKKNQNEEIHLVDGKRSYNVDIGLSRFKLTHQQIKDAILLMDEKVLNLDKIIKLRKYIPDNTEQELLRNFDGDVTLLAHTEKFFLALCNVPDLVRRMELFQFKLQFKELVVTQQDRIDILRKSHDNVKNNESFKIILKYILAFGNYMNGGTRKGQAFGFKLNSLRQVCSAKSMDNKTTLLHYLYLQIEKQNKTVLQFVNDFEILAEGSRLDVSQLSAEVSKIGGAINKIHKKLTQDKNKNKSSTAAVLSPSSSKNDLFNPKMTLFLSEAEPHYGKLKKEHDSAKADCVKLADFFNCKNDIKFEFFKDLYEFSQSFKKVGIEIAKKREKELKELKAKQYKSKRQERLNNKNNSRSPKSSKNKTSKSNGHSHRRTSSNRAKKLYSKNGLNKKRNSLKKTIVTNGNSHAVDPQFADIMNRQKNKNGNVTPVSKNNARNSLHSNSPKLHPQSYAKRRQSRNQRKATKSPRKGPVNINSVHETNDNNKEIINRSQTTPILQSQTPFAMNGLPPPPPQLDENYGNYQNDKSYQMTENVVNDINHSEVEYRRKVSAQISRNKNKTAKKKKKSRWFG